MEKRESIINKSDMKFLAKKFEAFIEFAGDPQRYFEKNVDDPACVGSSDSKVLAMAMFLLCDTYLRGKGINAHHRSKTQLIFLDMLSQVWEGIRDEIESRPYRYPESFGSFGRSMAAVEIDWITELIRRNESC